MDWPSLAVLVAAIVVYAVVRAWWRGSRQVADLSDVLRTRINGVDPVDAHAQQAIAAAEPVDRHCEDLGRTAARRRAEIAALQQLFDLPSNSDHAQEG